MALQNTAVGERPMYESLRELTQPVSGCSDDDGDSGGRQNSGLVIADSADHRKQSTDDTQSQQLRPRTAVHHATYRLNTINITDQTPR